MEYFNHIHCKYTGVKGFVKLYEYGLKWTYMITHKAQYKLKVLIFWKKHGLEATLDAFPHKRSTLYLWKQQFNQGQKKPESLNEKSRKPINTRIRLWPHEVIQEIKRIRLEHPNLGKDKIYPELKEFCKTKELKCPKPTTIGRIIKDKGGLRITPQKVSHFGKIKSFKRKKVIRKPKNFKTEYPGHLVALDTIERFVHGLRRYIITFEDIHTRFSFAWSTTSHASKAAKEFFDYCQLVFPFPIDNVLTDNGSEFKKHFNQELERLSLLHYHTYPKSPRMNGHLERFNRTIQEEFVDYNVGLLMEPNRFNQKLIEWLIWYNTKRVHSAFQNKLSPLQYIMTLEKEKLPKIYLESKNGWAYTIFLHFLK
jgi:transposase InsO family protein